MGGRTWKYWASSGPVFFLDYRASRGLIVIINEVIIHTLPHLNVLASFQCVQFSTEACEQN